MPVAVLGFACRVPGGKNEADLWQTLIDQRCVVSQVGPERWELGKYLHSRVTERGFAYTFAAGLIDRPKDFDHTVFGISPREAEQIDPQQRLLLEVVWEALESIGLPPSEIAGTRTGVYVGASMLDYGNRQTSDGAGIEAHFMTGNSMSVLSNRISYTFDLTGPSSTIDTACSSGMVAFDAAVRSIEAGVSDFAIVAGVNLILSAAAFVGFSRAGMLSPTGRCRPFSSAADGYVRAEGAVAFIIGNLDAARARGLAPRAIVLATGVNSDGRTSGISLPSTEGQQSLLDELYGLGGIDAEQLAFVEAHGTGTRVGDPAEAGAIGTAIGKRRSKVLPIGSIKSNIGHLEPVSGLAGLAKALMALEHRLLPASLHLAELNPDIPFDALNLQPAVEPVTLIEGDQPLAAGISSFGFGGTNAHAAIRLPTRAEVDFAPAAAAVATPRYLMVSAASDAALRARADDVARMLVEQPAEAAALASAIMHRGERMSHRAVVPWTTSPSVANALADFGATGQAPGVVVGTSFRRDVATAFVYTGNGAQKAGMGRQAYLLNASFRAEFDQIDARYAEISGWSLKEALFADDLATRLERTSVAQPLIFAIQAALTACLKAEGFEPAFVLGHSVGEVAAAMAAGILTQPMALKLIHRRSIAQETVFGAGLMSVLAANEETAASFCAEIGEGLEIAAVNSSSSVTLTGTTAAIQALGKLARKRRVAARQLDIRYPFHSSALDAHRDEIDASLAGIDGATATVPFISTVTGGRLDDLGADYWWHNIRDRVRFREAVRAAAEAGATFFVEIGPRPILTGAIQETLRDLGLPGEVTGSLTDSLSNEDIDPIAQIVARGLASGARIQSETLFGTRPTGPVKLPTYPWQRRPFQIAATVEEVDIWGTRQRHPTLGARLSSTGGEWHNLVDTVIVPWLTDHRVDGEAVAPGAALAEMALAAARELYGDHPVLLEDFDILQPLVFTDGEMRETLVRIVETEGMVEIASRRRFGTEDDWVWHARGRVSKTAVKPEAPRLPGPDNVRFTTRKEIYDTAFAAGLDYGPSFQLVDAVRRDDDIIDVDLAVRPDLSDGRFSLGHVIDPAAIDAAFHGLFSVYRPARIGEKKAFLPVRFARLYSTPTGRPIVRARLEVPYDTGTTLGTHVTLIDDQGDVVLAIRDGLFRSVILSKLDRDDIFFHWHKEPLRHFGALADRRAALETVLADGKAGSDLDGVLLLDAFAQGLLYQSLLEIAGSAPFATDDLVVAGRIDAEAVQLFNHALDLTTRYGLASEDGDRFQIIPDLDLPDADALFRTVMADFPESGAEIAFAALLRAKLAAVLRSGDTVSYRAAVLEHYEQASATLQGAFSDALALVHSSLAGASEEVARILVVEEGGSGLVRALLPLVRAGRIRLTVTGPDAGRLSHTAARLGQVEGLDFTPAENLTAGAYSLALGVALGAFLDGREAFGDQLMAALAANAAIAVFHPAAHPIVDLAFAVTPGWLDRSLSAAMPLPLRTTSDETQRQLGLRGGVNPLVVASSEGAWVVASRPGIVAEVTGPVVNVLMSGRPVPALAETLGATVTPGAAINGDLIAGVTDLIHVLPIEADEEVRERTAEQILSLARLATGLSGQSAAPRLWIVTSGAWAEALADVDAVARGLWCFTRVMRNEFGDVDVRLLDLDGDPRSILAAADVIRSGTAETEIVVEAGQVSVLRAQRGRGDVSVAGDPVAAVKLEFARKGALESNSWVPDVRRAPGEGEIEVEIAASGLNFRDVMFALGILPEELLEGGFAGPVVGFECSGTVVRVGSGVAGLAIGDRVMAFAPGALASHVIIPAGVASHVPDHIKLEAAATMPVALLTAWYGLVNQARIRKGDVVLVHGAAGSVGLAALQIARAKGARVLATAGASDKRGLVMLSGAERVYDSRSIDFAEAIRREYGGVDVVLNSLSGDAMQASLSILKPFGRFVELGKRDFLANTRIGLRPFRHNLSYYGVDVDQLLLHDPQGAAEALRDINVLVREGALTPLPYRTFEADEVAAAFRLMQGSGHIGKIIIKPPVERPASVVQPPRFAAGEGVHLVVGGLGGFGFETAVWLAERGARTIVAASRRGVLEPGLDVRVAALREKGVNFVLETLDVTDFAQVSALLARISPLGPLVGVFHTAVVLDDGLINSLTPERLNAVLAPKVNGIENLDRATRGLALDYFVAYSSVSAFIGNPGQGAYVAANGHIEGVIRRRRAAGLPGLAVAWGKISDVGLLARNRDVNQKVSRILGNWGLESKVALDLLGDIIADQNAIGLDGTVVASPLQMSAAGGSLATVRSPTLASIYRAELVGAGGETADIAELIAGKSDNEARSVVEAFVAEMVARILRVAASEIDLNRPLTDLGMDSLMALELRLTIEKQLGIELPLVAITAGKSLSDLAQRIVGGLREASTGTTQEVLLDGAELAYFEEHGGDENSVAVLAEAVVRPVAVASEPAE